MSSSLGLILSSLIPAIALVITILSAYYVYRQKTTAYGVAKTVLVFVHVLFSGVLILEFLRPFSFANNSLFYGVYTIGATSFVLWDVVLLTWIALAVYSRPTGEGKTSIFSEVMRNRLHFAAFGILIAYVTFLDLYLGLSTPYSLASPGSVINIMGTPIWSIEFNNTYLLMLLPVLIYFIIYPSTLLFVAARKIADRGVRRALILLPLNWSGIGAELLFFNGYLINTLNIDAISSGYLIAAIAFSVTAMIFRRASMLASLFEPVEMEKTIPVVSTFSKTIGMETSSLLGKSMLLEVDTSVSYEAAVREFVLELLSNGLAVFAFTSKGSPIYNTLSESRGVRIYLMSAKVSYPKPGERPTEVLVPQYDQPILLDLLEKMIVSNKESGVAVVYDNVSDMLLFSGFESSYKFIKQANEIVNEPKVTSLFIITHGAHEEKMINQIKGLFPMHLSYDQLGLTITRKSAGPALNPNLKQ